MEVRKLFRFEKDQKMGAGMTKMLNTTALI